MPGERKYLLEVGDPESIDFPTRTIVESMSFTRNPAPSTGTGGISNQQSSKDIFISRKNDEYSPVFMQYCASGRRLAKVSILEEWYYKGTPLRRTVFIFDEVYISSCTFGGNGEYQMDQMALNFSSFSAHN